MEKELGYNMSKILDGDRKYPFSEHRDWTQITVPKRIWKQTLFMILSTTTYLPEYMVILTRIIHEHNSFSDTIWSLLYLLIQQIC